MPRTMVAKRRLGKSELEVTPIGLGCWQFSGGRGVSGSYWGRVDQPTIDAIVRAALAGGIDWFDTAEIYGRGRSERALSRALQSCGKKPGEVRVATKWFPLLRTAESIRDTIDERLRCLDPFPIDLHQVHQPISFSGVEAQMNAMADLVALKKIRAVGVSNFNERRTRAAHAALAARGLPLASNQMRYSLLDRRIETNGVLAACKELGVTLMAYSPLAQGILSGKFHRDPALVAKTAGPRRLTPAFRARGMEKSRPLVEELEKIAKAHGATPSQVSLAWLLQFHGDGVVAIPGATKEHHVKDLVDAMDITLSPLELSALDEMSRPFM
jgi:aryl-alcohol dehydrogenase-like predicted oxidoreductase